MLYKQSIHYKPVLVKFVDVEQAIDSMVEIFELRYFTNMIVS